MGRAERDVSEIIRGKRAFTPETAQQLEYVLGIKSSFWINAQRNFEDTKLRLKKVEMLKAQAEFARRFPYAEMAKYRLVPATRNAQEKVDNLLSFFSVGDFSTLEKLTKKLIEQPTLAARKSIHYDVKLEKLSVWIRM
jgi:HTH-type transcriptional regulator/antitoxin HigA